MRLPREQREQVDRLAAPKADFAERTEFGALGDPFAPSQSEQTWQHWSYSGGERREHQEAEEAGVSLPLPPPSPPMELSFLELTEQDSVELAAQLYEPPADMYTLFESPDTHSPSEVGLEGMTMPSPAERGWGAWETASQTDSILLSWRTNHNASSAPWSSTPSLHELGRRR
jgi:hypothetical protein